MQPNNATIPNGELQTLLFFSAALIPATPYITAFLTQSHLPRWANEVIAFLVSAFAGVIAFLSAGGSFATIHSSSAAFAAVGVIFTGGKIYYKRLGYLSPVMIRLKAWGPDTEHQAPPLGMDVPPQPCAPINTGPGTAGPETPANAIAPAAQDIVLAADTILPQDTDLPTNTDLPPSINKTVVIDREALLTAIAALPVALPAAGSVVGSVVGTQEGTEGD